MAPQNVISRAFNNVRIGICKPTSETFFCLMDGLTAYSKLYSKQPTCTICLSPQKDDYKEFLAFDDKGEIVPRIKAEVVRGTSSEIIVQAANELMNTFKTAYVSLLLPQPQIIPLFGKADPDLSMPEPFLEIVLPKGPLTQDILVGTIEREKAFLKLACEHRRAGFHPNVM